MKLKYLITLDLPGVTSKQREKFDNELVKSNFMKIPNLTTTWKGYFAEGLPYDDALKALKHIISNAKKEAEISTVIYAIQIGENDVFVSNLI